jgi:hypothetical protein
MGHGGPLSLIRKLLLPGGTLDLCHKMFLESKVTAEGNGSENEQVRKERQSELR